jgi:hypothetical protein
VTSPAPDDWQQLAAQHRQAEFRSNVARISKSGRRGNRIFGGTLILFGAVALLLGAFLAVQLFNGALDAKKYFEDVVWMLAGGAITVGTGVFVWRGTFTRRR